ncbi:hypothetical protein [Virgibacillus proomii]|uniref:hypothetical protein n=1 Tax=Virgibacillus proomii TaxID=84407 RepID=UPI001C120E73|nr:hypothetical protein [Virgibacillus proomii]MBU5267139.1 hypothetical protein [Virgibacillus proomii]
MKLRQQYTARRKSVLLFQGQRSYGSNTPHTEKVYFFFKESEFLAFVPFQLEKHLLNEISLYPACNWR